MGILDDGLRDDIDIFAFRLLREVDPDRTADILAALLPGATAGRGQEVYVDGQLYGHHPGNRIDDEWV
jgi:hypothetical protein